MPCKKFSKHKEVLQSLFPTIMGQLGSKIESALEGLEWCNTMDLKNKTVDLMKELTVIHHRDDGNRPDPIVDVCKKTFRPLQARHDEQQDECGKCRRNPFHESSGDWLCTE